MKRAAALTSLSREHHQALVVAQKLRRTRKDTSAENRAAFLSFWECHGSVHFRLEEELLLPAFAAHGDPHHPLVARTLCDHVAIRQQADQLANDNTPTPASLQHLGTLLATHVRMEERELFPVLEQAMPADQLELTARALHEHEQALAQRHQPTDHITSAETRPIDLTQPQGDGPVWSIASADLTATLLSWAPGPAIAEHVNEDRDVLLLVIEGHGTATVDEETHALRPQHALLINKGTRRRIQAGASGLRYLSIHLRRGALQIDPASPRT